jgi:hypothetical protein
MSVNGGHKMSHKNNDNTHNNQQLVGEKGHVAKERHPELIGLGGKQIIFIRTKIITFIS